MVQMNLSVGNEGIKEWCLVELQGDLECNDPNINSKFIGDLHYTKQNVPVMVIGHHILYGKVSKLEKPFIVMKKVANQEETVGYNVKSVIRRKVVFKTRPKPIIAEEHVLKKI